MRSSAFVVSALTMLLASIPAGATYNATVVGTVVHVQQQGDDLGNGTETITFRVTNQPGVACPNDTFDYFVISPETVSNAQTRKNMLAILLSAKMTGSDLQVAYDSTGGFCYRGMPGVYYLTLL